MSKPRKARKGRKQGDGERRERIRARMAASAMASPEELAAILGITLNQTYAILRHGLVKAMRLRRRWLIPRAEIARIRDGDISKILGTGAVHLVPPSGTEASAA